jgi:hypothetical protein
MTLRAFLASASILLLCLVSSFVASVDLGVAALMASSALALLYALKTKNGSLLIAGAMALAVSLWMGWALWGVDLVLQELVLNRLDASSEETARNDTMARYGQLGDLFGGINALLSSLALIGVSVAAYYQYKSTQLLEAQNLRQNFESIFFQLLARAEPPEFAISAENAKQPKNQVVLELESRLKSICSQTSKSHGESFTRRQRWYLLKHLATDHKHRNEAELGPFFRRLFHVFRYVASSGLSPVEQDKFANIVRAGLSSDDLALLAINAHTEEGRFFLPLIERFGVFKHLPRSAMAYRVAQLAAKREAFMSATERRTLWASEPKRLARLTKRVQGLI